MYLNERKCSLFQIVAAISNIAAVLLQCILSIFPASVHQFYAYVLVFININPFLYINDQFALSNTLFRGLKTAELFQQQLNKTFDMRHLFWILIGLSNVLLVLFIQFSCMKWEINEFDLLWFFCQYHGWQSLVWLFLFNWKWFFNHLPRFFGVCPSLYFNPLHWHLSFRSNLIIYGFFP